MNSLPLSEIGPLNYKNQFYFVKSTRIGFYQGKEVYLATNPLSNLPFWKRCLSLIFSSILALFHERISSQIWYNKAIEGKDTIAVQLDIDESSPSDSLANRVNSLIVRRQAADECMMGLWYKNGTGVPKDLAQAKKLFESAAQKQNKEAAYELGLMYSEGLGVEIDHDKAIENFEKAIAWGSTKLEDIYATGCRYKQMGLTCRMTEVDRVTLSLLPFLSSTLEIESQSSANQLKNYHIARRYLSLAADNRHPDAAYELGLMYSEGLGVEIDHDRAIGNFGKAIAWGSTKLESVYAIGRCYKQKGSKCDKVITSITDFLGKKKQSDQAILLIQPIMPYLSSVAGAEGIIKSCHEVRLEKYDIARKYLSLAADNRHPEAAHALGLMHSKGLGCRLNQDQAKEYFEKAFIWRGGLELALHHRTQGNISEAQRLEESLKAFKLAQRAPVITGIGGELLAIAINLPDLEKRHRQVTSSSHAALLRERFNLISLLNREGVLPIGEDFPFRESKGVCAGMKIEFIIRLNNVASVVNLESKLIEIAQNFESRSGIAAVALQSIFSILMDRVIRNFLTRRPIFSSFLPTYEEIVCENQQTALSLLYKIHGQKLVSLPALGVPGQFSEAEYLKQWLTGSDGAYGVNIKLTNSSHALAFIKQGRQVYIWDPSYGLIKCSADNPVDTIIRYLATVYPEVDNHHLGIYRVERLMS